MYRLTNVSDGLMRVWTATAENALRYHFSMREAGLRPAVSDARGKSLKVDDLERLASEDRILQEEAQRRVLPEDYSRPSIAEIERQISEAYERAEKAIAG